ncbi:VWA domain-containing protein [Dyella sp.]|uniref:VWA domain-containing protein n=1 Tax=Dyella sp. TaxID=1869338 RepID=UPI002ED22B59
MFEFAWPWLAIVLPLPWLLRRALRAVAPGQAIRLPYPELALTDQAIHVPRRGRMWLLALAWLCLVAAAMRPQWIGPPQAQQHSGRGMMLAIDLSGSMDTDDMELAGRPVSRLGAVKAIAGDFITRRTGDELGLTVFGTHAFLVTPLTYDLNAVRAQLKDADVNLAGSWTAMGDAIAVAVKRLIAQPEQARVLVLLTDGVSNVGSISPADAARAAKAAGVRIYTIGVGAPASAQSFLGMPIGGGGNNDLDEGTLREIANNTGGRYFRAADTHALAQAYQAIDALEPMPQRAPGLRPRHEWFRRPLLAAVLLAALAMLPSLAALRRKVAAA